MFISPDEKLLTSVLDNHPEPIVLHTPVFGSEDSNKIVDFILLYFNDAARRQADLPFALMKGQKVSQLTGYSQKGRKQLTQQLIQVYTTGYDLQTTYYNELLDIHFDVLRRKIDGAILSITKNVNAEIKERLEKQKQRELVDLMLSNSLNGWSVLDAVLNEKQEVTDFMFTRVNTIFLQVSGLSQEQVIGKYLLAVFPAIKQSGSFERYKEVYQTGIAQRSRSHYTAGNLETWYDSVVAKLGERSLMITFADITELNAKARELENKNYILDNIFNHSSNGISFGQVLRNEEGKIIDGKPIMANKAAIQLVGIPEELYFSKTSVELEPNILTTPYFQKIIHTMDTGEPSIAEYQLESTGRWIEISLSRMDRDHLIIIFTDVTEIKEIELQKERLIDELKRTNAALEDFTRAASHDLKEPLRKVNMFTDRLHQRLAAKMNEEETGLMEKVKGANQRMMMLVEDLLSYADMSYGTHQLEAVALNEKLKDVLSDLELVIQEKGTTIEIANLPVVNGYGRQLGQLFQNLISNALTYSKPEGRSVVTITAKEITKDDVPAPFVPDAEDYYLLQVKDNGIGFKQEHAEKIFQVFTRLHSKEKYSGTGIGLSIVKKVVENHRGFVYANSQEGNGATFSVLLPRLT